MTKELATEFARLVRLNLGDSLPQINRRNLSYPESACATHDFCDANMIMLDAWHEVFDCEPDVGGESDAAIWNAAWDMAKKAEFKEGLENDL